MSAPQDVRIVSADLPFSVMVGIAIKWVFALAIALIPLGALLWVARVLLLPE